MRSIRAAVLGSPIAHSLSPVLHTAGYRVLGIEQTSSYERFDVTAEQLPAFLAAHADRTGFSLTMPLKHALIELASAGGWQIDATAAQTGAGNTLVCAPDPHDRLGPGTRVLNTDVIGIVEAIREALPAGTGAPQQASILGAGATAASAVAAAARLGVRTVTIRARRPARAAACAALAERLGMEPSVGLLADFAPAPAGLLISTLPAGALDVHALRWPTGPLPELTVLDVAYAAQAAGLCAASAARGARAVSGVRMLIHQAVEQQLAFAAAAGLGLEADAWRGRLAAAMDAALPGADSAPSPGQKEGTDA